VTTTGLWLLMNPAAGVPATVRLSGALGDVKQAPELQI
jgi:hypothetical protein